MFRGIFFFTFRSKAASVYWVSHGGGGAVVVPELFLHCKCDPSVNPREDPPGKAILQCSDLPLSYATNLRNDVPVSACSHLCSCHMHKWTLYLNPTRPVEQLRIFGSFVDLPIFASCNLTLPLFLPDHILLLSIGIIP